MGSSSSSTSGCCNSRRHSATRRRSPPERCLTDWSGSGQRRASMARSSAAVQLPAVDLWSICSVQLALALDQLRAIWSSSIGSHELRMLTSSYSLSSATTVAAQPFLDHLADGFRIVQLRFLFEVADRIARREDHFALEILVQPGDDLHQRRFPGAVQPDDPDFSPVEKRQVDAVQHFFLVRESLADSDHREYDFFVCHIVFVIRIFLSGKDSKDSAIYAIREDFWAGARK